MLVYALSNGTPHAQSPRHVLDLGHHRACTALNPQAAPGRLLCLQIKFYWNTATCACEQGLRPLGHHRRAGQLPAEPKIFPVRAFRKASADPESTRASCRRGGGGDGPLRTGGGTAAARRSVHAPRPPPHGCTARSGRPAPGCAARTASLPSGLKGPEVRQKDPELPVPASQHGPIWRTRHSRDYGGQATF